MLQSVFVVSRRPRGGLDGICQMRPTQQFACLWQDACLRTPVRWRRAILAAAGSLAIGSLIGAAWSGAVPQTTSVAVPETTSATAGSIPEGSCQRQTWPYLSAACVERSGTADGPKVRVISLDRDAPSNAYVYPEAPKSVVAKSKRPAASRETKTEGRGQRSTKRRAAPQREARPPDSAYRAYGYSRADPRRR